MDLKGLEHCPDFNERATLLDGRTRGVPYPEKGYNCNGNYGLAQEGQPLYVPYNGYKLAKDLSGLQHCPDFNERMTLLDGKTRGIPYPLKGFNCNANYGLNQLSAPLYVPYGGYKLAKDLKGLQHCPDFNERMTLLDGKTRGIPYPEAGFNCNGNYGLAQEGQPLYVPYNGYKLAKDLSGLQHCPDF